MKFAAGSSIGLVREINEDSYNIIAGYPGIPVTFIIADGMGGHNSGEVASKMAVDIVSNLILQQPELLSNDNDILNTIQAVLKKANTEIFNVAKEHETNFGMGTTLIIAVAFNGNLLVGHIGDSRLYLIRDRQIERITTDHSFIEELIKTGSLTREEAEKHPKKNIITRALGCSEEIQVDTYSCRILHNDILILCTDGLTNMVNENEIKDIVLEMESPESACEKLINRANENGGEDNTTVIVILNE